MHLTVAEDAFFEETPFREQSTLVLGRTRNLW